MSLPALDLVLLWHMHQPDYRDAVDGRFLLPWVYLHAVKDYADMAAHVERHPHIRAVFNFVPVLLEQLDDYALQFQTGAVRDPLLALLNTVDLAAITPAQRALVLDSCFHGSHQTMLEPYPAYRRLLALFRASGDDPDGEAARRYLSADYVSDLLTWYHLAWIGESARRSDPLFTQLMTKGSGFDHADRRRLFDAIGATVAGLSARYRALAATGRIELSTTPQAHPIGPLLLDFGAARETLLDAPLPVSRGYPGGDVRLDWHLRRAIDTHRARFGEPPSGLWPAEGAVSEAFVQACARAGFRWTASSESVLANSLGPADGDRPPGWLHRAWRTAQAPGVMLLFRDERLSDQIGFEYSKWHGRDAAAHLIAQLEAIGQAAPEGETPVVLIAMDGENAWEYYPYNAYYFFEELYSGLSRHPWIRTRTMSDVVARHGPGAYSLPHLTAGSWVLGTLSTWIGEPAKNAAWDLLCDAKRAFDAFLAAHDPEPALRARLERQLAACEGSDWFWWLGSNNPEVAVGRFDRLFRHNLRRLYALLGSPAPAALERPLASGSGEVEAGGTMRRATRAAH